MVFIDDWINVTLGDQWRVLVNMVNCQESLEWLSMSWCLGKVSASCCNTIATDAMHFCDNSSGRSEADVRHSVCKSWCLKHTQQDRKWLSRSTVLLIFGHSHTAETCACRPWEHMLSCRSQHNVGREFERIWGQCWKAAAVWGEGMSQMLLGW
jgi:hypothetical protein